MSEGDSPSSPQDVLGIGSGRNFRTNNFELRLFSRSKENFEEKSTHSEADYDEDDEEDMIGVSLRVFDTHNPFRIFCHTMATNNYMKHLKIVIYLFHLSVLIATPSILSVNKYLQQLVLAGIYSFYTVDLFFNVIAFGIFENRNSFLKKSWNIFETICIACFWVSLGLTYFNYPFHLFAAIAAAQTLKILTFTSGTQKILKALAQSLPMLINVLSLLFFFWLLFAIFGVRAFQGSLQRRCFLNETELPVFPEKFCGSFIGNDTFLYPPVGTSTIKGYSCPLGQYCAFTDNPEFGFQSFDNILTGFLTVFVSVSMEGWTQLMYNLQDSEIPWAVPIYFVILVTLVSFVMVNLFIAVVTETFAKTRQKNEKSRDFFEEIAEYLDESKGEWGTFPVEPKIKRGLAQKFAKKIAGSYPWNIFIICMIILNLVIQATRTSHSTETHLTILRYTELGFTAFFALECLFLLFAFGRTQFKKKTFVFNVLLAIVTCIIQLPWINSWFYYPYFTAFQILRVVRVVNGLPLIKKLVNTAFRSGVAILFVLLFIAESMSVFAVVMIQLFVYRINNIIGESEDDLDQSIFTNFWDSFLSMFTILLGDNWQEILYGSMNIQYNLTVDSYIGYSYVAVLSNAFFLALVYIFLKNILINMVVAAILENFELAEVQKIQQQYDQYLKETKGKAFESLEQNSNRLAEKFLKNKVKTVHVPNLPSHLVAPIQKEHFKEIFESEKAEEALKDKTMTMSRKKKGEDLVSGTQEVLNINEEEESNAIYHSRVSLFSIETVQSYLTSSINAVEAILSRNEESEKKTQTAAVLEIDPNPPYDLAFMYLSPKSRIRKFAKTVVTYSLHKENKDEKMTLRDKPLFDWFVLIIIVVSTAFQAYESPVLRLEPSYRPEVFSAADYFFILVFSFEFIVRSIADGMIFTPKPYLKSFWNVLDLFILISMYLDAFWFRTQLNSQGISRFFRAVRAARPLRIINQFEGIQEIFLIIVRGWKEILKAVVILFLIFFSYAIWGVNLWAGRFDQCNDPTVSGFNDCVGVFWNQAQENGVTYLSQRVWGPPQYYKFDNVLWAFLTLFEMSSSEGWLLVYGAARNYVGDGQQPRQEVNEVSAIFFLPFMILGAVFVVGLFIGVVVNSFQEKKGMSLMTDYQKRWQDLNRQLDQLRPSKLPKRPENKSIRQVIYDAVADKRGRFAKFITAIMILNVVVIVTEYYSPAKQTTVILVQEGLILFCLATYFIEFVLKLYAYEFSGFWKSKWNVYDAFVVIGAIVCTISVITLVSRGQTNYYLEQTEKVLLLLIVFRLVQKLDNLETLFKTVISSVKSVWDITMLLLLLLIIYSIMGVQLFGLTRLRNYTNERANFRDFGTAILTMFRMMTGEDWNKIMHDLSIEGPYCVSSNQQFETDCGSPSWSFFLFISFFFIGTFLILNMFIVVILDNFSFWYQEDATAHQLKRDDLRNLKKAWKEFDLEGKGYIPVEKINPFLKNLRGAFEVRIYRKSVEQDEFLKKQSMEVYKSKNEDIDEYKKLLQSLASSLDSLLETEKGEEIKKRREEFNMIFLECLLESDPRQRTISFEAMVRVLSFRLIEKEEYLSFRDRAKRNLLKDRMRDFIALERVTGFLYNLGLRKKMFQDKRIAFVGRTSKKSKNTQATQQQSPQFNQSPGRVEFSTLRNKFLSQRGIKLAPKASIGESNSGLQPQTEEYILDRKQVGEDEAIKLISERNIWDD